MLIQLCSMRWSVCYDFLHHSVYIDVIFRADFCCVSSGFLNWLHLTAHTYLLEVTSWGSVCMQFSNDLIGHQTFVDNLVTGWSDQICFCGLINYVS
jgi:hypothetical protein